MNRDEATVKNFLNQYGSIAYEPDGNVPPDFSINGAIAVEVRRLNQNYQDGKTRRGLETDRVAVEKAVASELNKYKKEAHESGYWLALNYQRPVGSIKKIRRSVAKAIRAFEAQNQKVPFRHGLTETVVLEFAAASRGRDEKYELGAFLDQDRGGWIIDTYATEINYCSKEKARKISSFFINYSEWWLVLVDHIDMIGFDSKASILKAIVKPSAFTRLVVVSKQGQVILEI